MLRSHLSKHAKGSEIKGQSYTSWSFMSSLTCYMKYLFSFYVSLVFFALSLQIASHSILLCRLALPCLHSLLIVSCKCLTCTPANSVQFSHYSIGPLFWPLPARIEVDQIVKICYSLLILQSSFAYASFSSILTLPPDMRSL